VDPEPDPSVPGPAESHIQPRPAGRDALHRLRRLTRQQPSPVHDTRIQVQLDEASRVLHRPDEPTIRRAVDAEAVERHILPDCLTNDALREQERE
jgi:hypothetical protein